MPDRRLWAAGLMLVVSTAGHAQTVDRDWFAEARKVVPGKPLADFTYTSSIEIDAQDETRRIVGKHLGGKTGDDAWVVLEAHNGNGKALEKKDQAERLDMDVPAYDELVSGLQEVSLMREDETLAVYSVRRFESDPVQINTGVDLDLEMDDQEKLIGEVVVRKASPVGPFVERVDLRLPEAEGFTLLATLDALELGFGYSVDQETKSVLPTAMDINVAGSVVYFVKYDVAINVTNAGFSLPE